jgi:NAD+ synthase
MTMGALANRIAEWLRGRLSAAGARGFVVGLSGGVDSAVVVRLCQIAAPDAVLAVLMPSHSDPRDERDAMMVADHFGIATVRADLTLPYDQLTVTLSDALARIPPSHRAAHPAEATDIRARVPMANVTPRLRMATLYFFANSLNYLVAGTGNRSELAIGYFTKYGDGGVDLLPIGHLLKSEVRSLARELGVPAPIIEKPPSAGLWAGQTDEAEMGFTYADLENYLTGGPETVAPALALRIERLVRASDHKHNTPPTPHDESGESDKGLGD